MVSKKYSGEDISMSIVKAGPLWLPCQLDVRCWAEVMILYVPEQVCVINEKSKI